MFTQTLLQPDVALGDTVLALTPERLQRYGLKGMILDVDETLVPFREAETSAELKQWLLGLKPHLTIWLVSNNTSEDRIRTIATSLDVPYLAGALKPSRRKLRRAVEAMGLPTQQVAMVGDRIFTDVLAGNRLGLFTIWVDPMPSQDGYVSKQVLRNTEAWISQRLGVRLS